MQGIMEPSDRIERRVKLQNLHILMTVVQAGSMMKAAERLNTGQPNISRSISELERALGVRLLERNRRGVEPTAYGRALLEGGTIVFDGLRQAVKTIEFLADPTAGEVRIGSTPLLASSFVSAVVDRLSQRHPGITFTITTGYVETLYRELCERNVDLLVTRKFGSIADERLAFELLFDDSSVVATGAQSPWVRRRKITLAELANERWVLPPHGSNIEWVAMDAFRSGKLDYPRTTVVTDSPHVRMSLLETGRYLTIFSASALRFSVFPGIKVLPVELPKSRVPNGIVTLKERALNPVVHLFIDQAREAARHLGNRR
jgi:DNA-binding transcriptional LysR family regulator